MNVIEEQEVLSESQYAFRWGRGKYTANLQLKNALETAWQRRSKLYGSSWDIKKAFDFVSKAVVRLAWTRLGVSSELIEWLVELVMDARVSVHTLWTVEVWDTVKRGERLLPLSNQSGGWAGSHKQPTHLGGGLRHTAHGPEGSQL